MNFRRQHRQARQERQVKWFHLITMFEGQGHWTGQNSPFATVATWPKPVILKRNSRRWSGTDCCPKVSLEEQTRVGQLEKTFADCLESAVFVNIKSQLDGINCRQRTRFAVAAPAQSAESAEFTQFSSKIRSVVPVTTICKNDNSVPGQPSHPWA